MTFGKAGHKNSNCISYKNANGKIINADHEAIGNQALAFVDKSGVQLGWLASQQKIGRLLINVHK